MKKRSEKLATLTDADDIEIRLNEARRLAKKLGKKFAEAGITYNKMQETARRVVFGKEKE